MKILVTGAAGFIGSHLCDRLLAAGHTVIGIDDLSTGSLTNLERARGDASFEFHLGDVRTAVVEPLIEQVDFVFHLASVVGVPLYVADPVRTIDVIVQGTRRVLEACARSGKFLLLTSTSEVYGKTNRVPMAESDDITFGATDMGRWSYGLAKAIDEQMVLATCRHHAAAPGFGAIVVRLFNTVGERQVGAYGMVLPRFVEQALANRALTVYGAGTQTRTFCHVSDVVTALVALSGRADLSGRVFNIGSDTEISMLELGRRVVARTGSDSELALTPYTDVFGAGYEDIARRRPDCTRISEAIGWSPQVDLDGIIDAVVAWKRGSAV